jgi:hypothetical protein
VAPLLLVTWMVRIDGSTSSATSLAMQAASVTGVVFASSRTVLTTTPPTAPPTSAIATAAPITIGQDRPRELRLRSADGLEVGLGVGDEWVVIDVVACGPEHATMSV